MQLLTAMLLCLWSVSALALPESIEDLDPSSPSVLYHLTGGAFLSMFPYEPVPYDDYAIEVVYHETRPAQGTDLLVIAFGGEADDFFVMRKKFIATDARIEFFSLLKPKGKTKLGFGSCTYEVNERQRGRRTACEYTFKTYTDVSRATSIVRVQINFTEKGKDTHFHSYILSTGYGNNLQIESWLE